MRKAILLGFVLLGLAACDPPIPDSGYYPEPEPVPPTQTQSPVATQPAPQSEAQQTADAAVSAVRPSAAAQSQPAPATEVDNGGGISNEQSFEEVSARRSIESDAARLEQKRSQYTQVAPSAVPTRPSGTTPTPIEFALETQHSVGEKKYRRGLTATARRAGAACAQYSSADQAQDAFLKNGGPQKDKLGVDPDGDGFACSWNPAKYRSLARAGN